MYLRHWQLYQAVILNIQEARHCHAAGVVVGAQLPPLLQPTPQQMPPLWPS